MGSVNLSKHTVNLSKGEKINLSKSTEAGLSKIMIGLGWDPAEQSGGFFSRLFGAPTQDIDCDAWVMLLQNGKLKDEDDLVFYGHKEFRHKSDLVILHHGDNLTGEGEGDDEQISINLEKVPKKYTSILISVTIYHGRQRNQSFGNIKNTFIRVVDERDNFEICRFNQKEMAADEGAITFIAGELYRDGDEWQFRSIGDSTRDASIEELANKYI